jgi:glycosyltransferase involved in cell wall biosynthesis
MLFPAGKKLSMRIALFGPFMFELAVGLSENSRNDVHLFLDRNTLPRSLADEPRLKDSTFVTVDDWTGRSSILLPRLAPLTRRLAEFDVSLVTELGPIFARFSGRDSFFIPTGWDLKGGPFPVLTRHLRKRGKADAAALVVAWRLRSGIRAAKGIWAAPFHPFAISAKRLGVELTDNLPQPVNTELFRPPDASEAVSRSPLTIFHPSRMQFDRKTWSQDFGQWKGNDILLRGFAAAVRDGVDARLVLITRQSSTDEEEARRLLIHLGVDDRVEWRNAGTPAGFTWRDLAEMYREADVVVDEFGGWFGLVALEGASSGKPVINCLDPLVMQRLYPDGHPFVQAADEDAVSESLVHLSDPEVRAQVGHESRLWVLEHHDRRVVAARAEAIIAEAAGC